MEPLAAHGSTSRGGPDLRPPPEARPGIPRGLELPLPVGAPSGPSRAALVDGLTLEPPSSAHPLDDLLSGSASGSQGLAPPRGHGLREYRQVIGIGVATLVAAGAAVVYLRGPEPRSDKPALTPAAAHAAPSTAPTEAATTTAATAGATAPPAAFVEPTAPRRAAVPLLSVLSDPPGAEVVVDGEVLGKTPLILPAPNVPLLVLTLRLDGYVDWVGQVRPSEAGHMSLSPTLRKR
jgi:hypothetical protein